MDNGNASDQNQKELSITLAASSMINASDMLDPEAYQANLRRIQEVKEMVRKLELNNEIAHKNFIVDQLEKRVMEGRQAEDVLVQLKTQPGPSEHVQFAKNAPGDRPEVILPTTATVVEVPESHPVSSYSSSSPTIPSQSPQFMPQGRPGSYQRVTPLQIQPHNAEDVFRYYATYQQSTAPHSQVPIHIGQIGRYATQNVPSQSRVNNSPIHESGFQQSQVHQPLQSSSSYPRQVTVPPSAVNFPAVPGHYPLAATSTTVAPVPDGPIAGSANSIYHPSGFPTQPNTSRAQFTTYHQSQSLQSFPTASQIQAPLQPVRTAPVHTSSSQQFSMRPHQKPYEPPSGSVSKPAHVGPQLVPKLFPHPQPQLQSQRFPQSVAQIEQPVQQFQAGTPSQQPWQLSQAHLQGLPQSVDSVTSTNVTQSHTQPSHPPQPVIVQEKAQQGDERPLTDKATFIKLFQNAVERGTLHLKVFWLRAKASGISHEWFKTAIDSLPRDAWQAVVAQINQSGASTNSRMPGNAPPQHLSTHPNPSVPIVRVASPEVETPLMETTPVTQLATKPISHGKFSHSALGETSESYAAQLQYYAEQATKSSRTHMAVMQTASTGYVASKQTTVATPRRDVPQENNEVRTPKDANKSTLARDILRSLGRIVPGSPQGMGVESMDKASDHEVDRRPVTTPHFASPEPSIARPAIGSDGTKPSSISMPMANPNVQDEPQHDAPTSLTSTVLTEERGQAAVTVGSNVIDLTLEDSEKSVGGKEQGPTSPALAPVSVGPSSKPVSPTNTTSHTPLLEKLSLEELPVDIAPGRDRGDVRMHSPPLPLAAEVNMESTVSDNRSNGGVEPVSLSFGLPHRASEHLADGQLPLFLPSPPNSPATTEPSQTGPEIVYNEGEHRPSLKRRFINIDEMGIDSEIITAPQVKKRPKQQVYVLVPSVPPHVRRAIKKAKERVMGEDVDLELEGVEDEESRYSHLEQLLIEESKARLLERRCQWLNCVSILNCATNLLAHLKNHVDEDSQSCIVKSPFRCRWAACQRRFYTIEERNVHLEKHTTSPLPCPFAGCDEQFDKPVEVMQHEVMHQKMDCRESLIRKPTGEPIVPAIPAQLGPPPHQLPSHRVIPRRVMKCRISVERHAILGPWILWNIFSPVEPEMRKQNASMRGRPMRQTSDYNVEGTDERRDDYDFLLALSCYSGKSRPLDDLDSTLITMSAARGLTLWGPEPENDKGVPITGAGEEDAVE